MRKKYVEAMLAAKDAELNAQIEANRADKALERERLDFEKQKHEDELRVKDRVDVSLKEYEALKRNLATAEAQLREYEKLLSAIKLDATMVNGILPDTVHVNTTHRISKCTELVSIMYEYDPQLARMSKYLNY